MVSSSPAEMTADERDAFLGTQGSGVISFATEDADESPHSVPISYGYDPGGGAFYFRLAVGEDREKSDLTDRAVTFVVYGHTDDGWRSVVASGHLESTTEADIATEALAGLEGVRIPLVDVFGKRPADVQFGFFRLVPGELTSREETRTGL